MLMPRFITAICSTGVLTLGTGAACGQDYPNKAIRIITSPAGGGSDFTARIVAQGVSAPLGQQVIVDNRTALQAAEAVSKASPDGYSLLVGGGVLWIGSLLRPSPFDALRDFTPITMTERTVHVVTVHPSLPVKNVKELIALAKARPGELNYGSAGAGSAQHLGVELFKAMTGVNIVHVPYKGGGPALTALVGGEMQMTIYDSGGVGPHVKSGRLRALAVTSAEPSALVPGLPTVAASGVPGYESVGADRPVCAGQNTSRDHRPAEPGGRACAQPARCKRKVPKCRIGGRG